VEANIMAALFIIGLLAFLACMILMLVNIVKKKPYKRWGLGMIISFVVFIIGISTMGGGESPDNNLAETEPTTIEGKIEQTVRSELGSSNREGIKKVQDFTISESTEGYIVAIVFTIDDNLTEGFIKGGAKTDVFDVMKAVYSKYSIKSVEMVGTFPMKDEYGNVAEKTVLKCNLAYSTASKINWGNMYKDDLFRILDYLWWHPAFEAIE
jgi:hypothetical protein